MVKSLVLSILSVGLIGAPSIQSERAVTYDDNNETILLSGDELLYHYDNLYHVCDDIGFYDNPITLSYADCSYDFEEIADGAIVFRYVNAIDDYWYLYFIYSYSEFNTSYGINLDTNYIFVEDIGGTYLDSPLTIDVQSSYSSIKDAIELDIQANAIDDNDMPSVSDLFGYITQGVTNFVQSLGQAFTSVTSLFWDSTAATPGPTFVGLLMLVSIGAGLIYLAYNIVKGLIRRLRG